MAGVAFYFEENDLDVYSGRRIDLDAWNYACKVAGDVDRMLVVNRTDQHLSTPDHDLKSFEVVETLPELSNAAVLVCPWEHTQVSQSLWSFDHEVDWYIFGPAQGWASAVPRGRAIHIPQSGVGACHATHVGTTVMYHRYMTKGK